MNIKRGTHSDGNVMTAMHKNVMANALSRRKYSEMPMPSSSNSCREVRHMDPVPPLKSLERRDCMAIMGFGGTHGVCQHDRKQTL